MNQDLQDKLYKEFPKLYLNESFDGFWVDDSWYDLIYNLAFELYKIIALMPKEKQVSYYAVQCKDKFGGLRHYMSASTPEMNELINKAGDDSYLICHGCSKSNLQNRGAWCQKFCEDCWTIKKLIE